MVLKRLTRTRSSRHSASQLTGNGRSTACSSAQRTCRVEFRCLTCCKQKAGVRRAVGELSAAANSQRLVDGLLEAEVGLLHIAVLVRDTEVIGGRLQAIVAHDHAVALPRLSTSLGVERMDGSTEMIGSVPLW